MLVIRCCSLTKARLWTAPKQANISNLGLSHCRAAMYELHSKPHLLARTDAKPDAIFSLSVQG